MNQLFLANGVTFSGKSFGFEGEALGEVVFTTGMTGYLEVLTDPSYFGQIVVFTFPLIGNYGVQAAKEFASKIDEVYESSKIWVKGVIIAENSEEFSHEEAVESFSSWLKKNKIPALTGVDTRALTIQLREHGTILGNIGASPHPKYEDPLAGRYVPEVSPKEIQILEPKEPIGKTIAFIDCGAKNGIFRSFLQRGIRVLRLPFDQNPFDLDENFDGVFFSNGPGNPSTLPEVIETASLCIEKKIPTFGICLGSQILALAAGGKTEKMKYGHRSVNQPVQNCETKKCIVTTQNHGFVVSANSFPTDFEPSFINLNDKSIEGLHHKTAPIFAVQFHPEACAGPEDAQYLFDDFIKTL